MHQSRVEVALAIYKKGCDFLRSVRGEVEKTSTKRSEPDNAMPNMFPSRKTLMRGGLEFSVHLLFGSPFSLSRDHGAILRTNRTERTVQT